MQQVNDNLEQIHLIQQGNNSYIHRKCNGQSQVIKSVFHSQLDYEDQDSKIHQRECADLVNEWKILSSLNHHYIIKAYAFIPNHRLQVDGELMSCCSLFLESAVCDLFTICKSNESLLPIKTLIKYFKQMGLAVEYLHSQNIAHNDIKLENMLVITRDVCKLADFGFSYKPPQDLIAKWLPRTLTCYTSPEIINFRNQIHESMGAVKVDFDEFSLFASDVYALTTSLFASIYKRAPILGAYPTMNDVYYQLLMNDPDTFWGLDFIQEIDNQLLSNHVPKSLLESLKDLIEAGLAEEYQRLTIEEFVNHEFFDQGQKLEEEKI